MRVTVSCEDVLPTEAHVWVGHYSGWCHRAFCLLILPGTPSQQSPHRRTISPWHELMGQDHSSETRQPALSFWHLKLTQEQGAGEEGDGALPEMPFLCWSSSRVIRSRRWVCRSPKDCSLLCGASGIKVHCCIRFKCFYCQKSFTLQTAGFTDAKSTLPAKSQISICLH